MTGEQQADDFHVGDTVRNRNTGAQMPVRPAPSGTWVPRYYELVSCPHEAEDVDKNGRPPAEVREALSRTLTVTWRPDAVEQAIANARAITRHPNHCSTDVYRVGHGQLSWMDLACLVDAATVLLDEEVSRG